MNQAEIPHTMQAVVLESGAPESQFRICDLPVPAPGPGEVLVRVAAAAFNPIDFQMWRGRTEAKLLRSPVLGRECAGEVVALGAGSRLPIGAPVFGYAGSLGSNGCFAEYLSLPEALLASVPATLSMEVAASLPMAALTALQCVNRLPLTQDAGIFVAGGAGGVGQWLLQLLQERGMKNIVTTAGNSESREAVLRTGLPEESILDYRSGTLTEQARALNGGSDFDCCIDLVGGAVSELCAGLLKVGGALADVAAGLTEAARTVLFDKAATIYNIANYAYAASPAPRFSHYGKGLRKLSALIGSGRLQAPAVHISDGLSAENVVQALRLLEQNGARGRKLVLRIRRSDSPDQ